MDVRSLISKFSSLIVVLVFLGAVNQLYAATQGKPGQTSSGSFTIRLVIPAKLEASQVATSQETTSGGVITTAKFNQKEPICIKGKGIDNYRLTAEGSGGNGAFIISSDQTRYNYDVELWTSLQTSSQMMSGQPSQAITSTPPYQDCNASDTRIAVSLDQLPAERTNLQGVLNLTVSAE